MSVNRADDQTPRDQPDMEAGLSAAPGKAPYETPCVVRVGDLHEILAGGAGSVVEDEFPFQKKMAGQPG